MTDTPSLARATSEGALRALFHRAVGAVALLPTGGLPTGGVRTSGWVPAGVFPSVLLAGAMACDCPVTVHNTDASVGLTSQQAAPYAHQMGEPLALNVCQQLCQNALAGNASYGGNSNATVLGCQVDPPSRAGGPDAGSAEADASGAEGDPNAGDAAVVSAVLTCEMRISTDCGGVGRWQSGAHLADRRGSPASSVARWLADAAALERLSVLAFHTLGRELDRLRAPLQLRQGVRRAQRDERRHTQHTRRLARAFGGSPRAPQLSLPQRPARLTLAAENALYGCVEETWGALLLRYQATHTPSPRLRRHFAALAEDETRHAALSWELHRWLVPQLTVDERAALSQTTREGVLALRQRVARPAPAELEAVAGLPDAGTAVALFAQLEQELFAAAA